MTSSGKDLENRTRSFIQSEGLLQNPDDPILLAVSGGVDSLVMSLVLQNLQYSLGIAHCNFQLRGEASEKDAEVVQSFANDRDIPFHQQNFSPEAYAEENGISLQMAARELRYAWFEQLRQQYGFQWIASAHHRDDLVETVMMNLVKGTGIKGLQGILPKQGPVIRPLLFADKEELIAYAMENGLNWREDESNQSVKYERNYLRHQVIPALKELNPGLAHTLYQNIQHFRDFNQMWERVSQEAWENLVTIKAGLWYLPIAGLQKLDPPQLYLHAFLHPLGFNQTQLKTIVTSLAEGQPGSQFKSSTHIVEVSRDFMVIGKHPSPYVREKIDTVPGDYQVGDFLFKMAIIENRADLDWHQGNTIYLDQDKLVFPLTFRNWEAGDYFYPLGMEQSKKLSDFFVDEKVSRLEKAHTLVLVTNDNQVVWIVGHRLDERFKIQKRTNQALRISYSYFLKLAY